MNNQDFENYLGQMYPAELEIKGTTESNTSASYVTSVDREGRSAAHSLYDKRDDFNLRNKNEKRCIIASRLEARW